MNKELLIGHIYLFKYYGYKQDPTPLVLVLWPGAEANFHAAKPAQLMHGINLNYLRAGMIHDVYKMIAKIATRQLSGNNTFSLYHDYMKRFMTPVITNAYRTYNLSKATGFKIVSKGFKETLTILNHFKNQEQQEQKIVTLVEKKVQTAKEVKTIIGHAGSINAEEAERRARLYLQEISKVKRVNEIDLSKFTFIRR